MILGGGRCYYLLGLTVPLSLFAKSVATAASAALLLGCPVAASAQASHPHRAGSHTKPSRKPVGRTHDRLAGPRHGATHAVNAQLKAVTALQSDAAALTGPDAVALQGAVAADQAAIQADLAAIPGAASIRALRVLSTSAVGTRQIARTQVLDVVAADAALAQGTTLETTVSTLTSSLATLATGGTDTTAGQAALTDATNQLLTVSTDVAQVVSTVLAVGPTAGRQALHLAAAAADTQLTAISAAIAAATSDINTVQTAYGL